jgi:hypothetical protein
MLDSVQLSSSIRMTFRKEAIWYAATMANISIKDNTSTHEKFLGVLSALKPENCINFGRIGYVTPGNKLKNKYKPRAFKCYMVGYAEDHSPQTYKKVFKYTPGTSGEILITRNVRWEHWESPFKSQSSPIVTKVQGLCKKPETGRKSY